MCDRHSSSGISFSRTLLWPRSHANVAYFPVIASDVVIFASDGLFDNVSVEDISQVVGSWETQHSGESLDQLAKRLCLLARDRSLDDARDSLFALLAKENDIMWGGGTPFFYFFTITGMPDDVTVVALRVDGSI